MNRYSDTAWQNNDSAVVRPCNNPRRAGKVSSVSFTVRTTAMRRFCTVLGNALQNSKFCRINRYSQVHPATVRVPVDAAAGARAAAARRFRRLPPTAAGTVGREGEDYGRLLSRSEFFKSNMYLTLQNYPETDAQILVMDAYAIREGERSLIFSIDL